MPGVTLRVTNTGFKRGFDTWCQAAGVVAVNRFKGRGRCSKDQV